MSNPFFHDESDIARREIWNYANSKSICSIASVVAINTSPVSVNIQPLIKYYDPVNQWQAYSVLKSVPVAQFQNTVSSINLPLNIGDTGIVLWVDREIYTTLQTSGTVPNIPSSGDLNNDQACIFIPCLTIFSKANPLKQNGVDIISSQVSLLTELIAETSNLITFYNNLKTFVQSIATLTPSGSEPLANAIIGFASTFSPQITTSLNDMNQIKSKLITFLGAQP